ncbi:MAG: hypothetical protein K0V04_27110 [Deltaproteobacteria bacterium]|nr:hypothetical protein [Deltaproteobacteria bacterium]
MDARDLEATETISASRKLGRDDARALLKGNSRLLVAKGKKVATFTIGKTVAADAVDAMLGPTGNLRAPTIRVGKTIVVGYHDDIYTEVFG